MKSRAANIFLTIFYFVVLLPFGVAMRLFTDCLRIKKRPGTWLDHPPLSGQVNDARGRQ
jgi:hypothetical protein